MTHSLALIKEVTQEGKMTHLGINWKDWESTIATSPDCLTSADSVSNVHHVLSKAVNRGPQKILFSKCGQHIGAMISSEYGQRILDAIVRFGTVKTVAGVAELLLKEEQVVGPHPRQLSLGTGDILKSICERIDDESEFRKSILKRIRDVDAATAIECDGWLRALTGSLPVDAELLTKLAKSKVAEKALRQVLSSPKKNKTALKFVEETLSALAKQSSQIDGCATFAHFVLSAISVHMKPDAKFHPRDEVLLSLAEHSDKATIDSLAASMTQWATIPEFIKHDIPSRILHAVLSRCTPTGVGEKLFRRVVPNQDAAKALASSRKATMLALVALGKTIYSSALTEAGGEDIFASAAVKLSASTKPRFLSTREAIAQKIAALNSIDSSKAPVKRARE